MRERTGRYVECWSCGRTIYRKRCALLKCDKFFCNYKCMGKWKEKNEVGKKNPHYKERISVCCSNCGKTLHRIPSVVKSQRNFFCNIKCKAEWQRSHLAGEQSPHWNRIEVRCEICDATKNVTPSRFKSRKHFFCSMKCVRKWMRMKMPGKGNRNYIDGRSFEPYLEEFSAELKELIRLRDGYKCQKCGCPEIENREKLSVHHIDYDKKNCLPSNLISLCRGCNAIVNANRERWQNFFQRKVSKHKQGLQLSFQCFLRLP